MHACLQFQDGKSLPRSVNTDLSLRLLCMPKQLLAGVLQDEIRVSYLCTKPP